MRDALGADRVVAFHHLHLGHQQDIYACSIYVTYASIIRILIIDPPIHDPFVDHQYSHGRTPPGAPEKAGVAGAGVEATEA